jgi:hypothetical protein
MSPGAGGGDGQQVFIIYLIFPLKMLDILNFLFFNLKKTKKIVNKTKQMSAIAAQNRFLNSELLRINDRCLAADRQNAVQRKKVGRLQAEMEDFKREYVFLLQSCVRVPLNEMSSWDAIQVLYHLYIIIFVSEICHKLYYIF